MIEKFKSITGSGWICIVAAILLAAIDALNKFAGLGFDVPPFISEAFILFATKARTTQPKNDTPEPLTRLK